MSENVPAGFEATADAAGFVDLVGPLFQRRDGEHMVYAFRAAGKHGGPRGVVHAGMLMAFAEHALARTARPDGGAAATVSLNTDCIAGPRQGDWIECRGRISRETRSLIFVKGELSVDGEIVMAATGVWRKTGAD